MKARHYPFQRAVCTLAAGSVIGVMGSTVALALTLDNVKLDPKAVAPACTAIDGEHAVSIQAATHYATVEKAPAILFKPPTRKAYQSFECGGVKSTIYFYEYASKADLDAARGFTEGQIWGGKGPTAEHPEIIIARDNVLVIISSRDPSVFRKHLEKQP